MNPSGHTAASTFQYEKQITVGVHKTFLALADV